MSINGEGGSYCLRHLIKFEWVPINTYLYYLRGICRSLSPLFDEVSIMGEREGGGGGGGGLIAVS